MKWSVGRYLCRVVTGGVCALLVYAIVGCSSASGQTVGRPPIKQPPTRDLNQRFAKANRTNERPVSSKRVAATVSSGRDKWHVTATPSGLMTPIATKKRAPVRVALHFPLAQPGQKAVATLLNEGRMHLVRVPDKSSKVLTATVGRDRTVRLRYEFGQALHNQKIEVKVGLARAILNLHLHDGSDEH